MPGHGRRDELADRRSRVRDDPLPTDQRPHRRQPPALAGTLARIEGPEGGRDRLVGDPPRRASVLDAVEESPWASDRSATADSREVLATSGNMSSPTVLFILDRLRRRRMPRSPASRSPSAPAWRSRRPSSPDREHRHARMPDMTSRSPGRDSPARRSPSASPSRGARVALLDPSSIPPRQGLRRVPQPRGLGRDRSDGTGATTWKTVGLSPDPPRPDHDPIGSRGDRRCRRSRRAARDRPEPVRVWTTSSSAGPGRPASRSSRGPGSAGPILEGGPGRRRPRP